MDVLLICLNWILVRAGIARRKIEMRRAMMVMISRRKIVMSRTMMVMITMLIKWSRVVRLES